MKKLHIAACDDNPEMLELLSCLISERFLYHNIITKIDKFSDPLQLCNALSNDDYDLLFLDIDMPKIDGITLAKNIRERGSRIDIIYISNKEELVFKTFDVQPFSFIRKSRFFEEIGGIVRSYVKKRESDENRILVLEQKSGDILTLDLNKTLYIEGDGKNQNAYLFMKESPLQIKSSMKELDDRLSEKGFIRVHKGFLVNYQFINSIKNNNVILTNGNEIPISRRNVNAVKEKYLNLMKWDKHTVE